MLNKGVFYILLERVEIRVAGINRRYTLVLLVVLLSFIVVRSFAFYSTIVSVYPQYNSVKVGQTFTIEVKVEGVSGLQGFDFCLKYPSSILNVSKVEEGPFMSNFGSTFVAKLEIEEDYQLYRGRVWMAVVICGDGFADGNGTLATITFEALAPGEGELDLFSVDPYRSDQVKLVTCGPEPIPHAVIDGHVLVSADANNPPDDPPENPNNPGFDLNGDGSVNMIDLAIVAKSYGKSSGEPGYNSLADLDQNGFVDIVDIALVAADFGKV